MSRKAKIIVHTGREGAEPPAPAHLLLLLSGVCALLLPMTDGLRYSVPRTLLLAASLCVFLWSMARIGWKWAVLCSMLCAILWCAAGILLQDRLSAQLLAALKLLLSSQSDGRSVPFDLAAAFLAVLLSLLFFSSELLIGSHVIPFTLVFAVFLLGPLIRARPSLEAAILALLFQFCYWSMNGAGMRQSPFDFALPSRARLTALTGGVMALILALVLLIAAPLSIRGDERLYAPAYAAEGLIKRAVSRWSGAEGLPVLGGKLNRGNQYPTGATHLILTASRKPSQPVYLRGFYGSAYKYGEWDREIEKEVQIFGDMASEWRAGWEMSQEEKSRLTGEIYHTLERMYYVAASSGDNPPQEIVMTVQRADNQFLNAYTPYYGVWGQAKLALDASGNLESGPAVSFYELQDLNMDWESVPGAETYRWIEEHYRRHMESVYTQVPTERVPRLAQLCRDHPLTDLDEITAFILRTLQSRASYSLTPGLTPVTQDMVDYFLFDNGLGYCQHFASAATLMYRLYGIPARYATGYVAMPEDFFSLRAMLSSSFPVDDDGEGTHVAVLSDFSAHAWVEIFLPGYGWTPIEVTPPADGDAATLPNYPGLNLDLLAQRLAEWDFEFPTTGADAVSGRAQQSLVASFAGGMSRQTKKALFRALIALLCCVSAAAFAALYCWRRRRLAFLASADCRVTFARLLSLLRFSGALPDCDGQEPDFPQRLAAAVPVISEADAVRLRRDAESAAYGPGAVPDADNAFARQIYQKAAAFLRDKLNFWKRSLFRWL